MAKFSAAAWAVHDVGLATAIGGTLFGRAALQPALREIDNPDERDRASATAWRRFSWLNLAAHAAFAATWLVGRSMLTGREVSGRARTLTKVKDGLVIASLVTGVGSVLLGRQLGRRVRHGVGRAQVRERGARTDNDMEARRTKTMQRIVGGLGIINVITNLKIAVVTALLAAEASESARFAVRSRRLP